MSTLMIFEDDAAESLNFTLMLISRSRCIRIRHDERTRAVSGLTLAMNLNQVQDNGNDDDGEHEQTRHHCRSL